MRYAAAAALVLACLSCAEPVGAPVVSQSAAPASLFDVTALDAGSSVVLPSFYATAMGESNNSFGFARPNMRYQQVFLGSELGRLRTLTSLCLRRDDTFGGVATVRQLTVRLAPTGRGPGGLSTTFADNYGAAPTTVFAGDVNIPESLGGGTLDDFYICIEFTATYTHPAGSNLLVETINTNTTFVSHVADFCFFEAGCTTSRVRAAAPDAVTGTLDGFNGGLIMKFTGSSDPQSKDECKNGGWQSFGFRNQGLCIQFVETGKDSRTS